MFRMFSSALKRPRFHDRLCNACFRMAARRGGHVQPDLVTESNYESGGSYEQEKESAN